MRRKVRGAGALHCGALNPLEAWIPSCFCNKFAAAELPVAAARPVNVSEAWRRPSRSIFAKMRPLVLFAASALGSDFRFMDKSLDRSPSIALRYHTRTTLQSEHTPFARPPPCSLHVVKKITRTTPLAEARRRSRVPPRRRGVRRPGARRRLGQGPGDQGRP